MYHVIYMENEDKQITAWKTQIIVRRNRVLSVATMVAIENFCHRVAEFSFSTRVEDCDTVSCGSLQIPPV